jgi:2-C-methyl-D-erythritol 4-phosphate cytidylyltransferase
MIVMPARLERIALVAAAGQGARFGGAGRKQYAMLLGRPLIYHAVAALAQAPEVQAVSVVLARDDAMWERSDWSPFAPKLAGLYCGGASRAESVLNGLEAIEDDVEPDGWVLVHDAARPCLTPLLVATLVRELDRDPVGGLLALPVADTLKRAQSNGRIDCTVSREGLWQAQTPQMFRLQILLQALRTAPSATDEAAAIESLGLHPKLVMGDPCNIKVTHPGDLRMAELILRGTVLDNADRSRR